MNIAFIHEEHCVGCTKCLDACPVDAIVGAANKLHTVITNDCIGCRLCLPPCPMDCIEMLETQPLDAKKKKEHAERAQKQHRAKKTRLMKAKQATPPTSLNDKLKFIQEALERVKNKKNDLHDTFTN